MEWKLYDELCKKFDVVVTGSFAVKYLTAWQGDPADLDCFIFGDVDVIMRHCSRLAELHDVYLKDLAFWCGTKKLIDIMPREKNKKHPKPSTTSVVVSGRSIECLNANSLLQTYKTNLRDEDVAKVQALQNVLRPQTQDFGFVIAVDSVCRALTFEE
jgi:hypothetical protein